MKNLVFILISSLCIAQVNPSRTKGEVFKHRPENPTENTDYSGLIVVTKNLYGLSFEDRQLSADIKNRVDKFFKHRLNGYTELKKYNLHIQKKQGKWFIENTKI